MKVLAKKLVIQAIVFSCFVVKTFSWVLLSALLIFACLHVTFAGQGRAAVEEEGKVGVEVVAILNTDERGEKLRYPSSVTYDRDTDEMYVVGGGEGKVIVYGANFFPTVSLGKGRGASSPRGVYIDRQSNIYLCQANSENQPARITLFNPAFFPQDEILFSAMPEGENFVPKSMAIGLSGDMYIVGQNTRGILVLDSEWAFSHWLKPKDKLFSENNEEMSRDDGVELPPELAAGTEILQNDSEELNNVLNMRDLLPPGLLPELKEDEQTSIDQQEGPVQVADIEIDSAGNLYVLSEETSKIYVYNSAEKLLFSFGQKGGSTGKMSRPKNLAVDEKKRAIYVVDYMRHTILIFDLGGRFMYEFGGMGTGPGWFQYPVALALNKAGNLIVADLFNQRVQILNINFEYKFPMFGASVKEQTPETDKEEQEPPDAGDIYLPRPL